MKWKWQFLLSVRRVFLATIVMGGLFTGCGGQVPETTQLQGQGPQQPETTSIDLAPFQSVARSSACTDIKNRIFLIDGNSVLWDREGNCADAAYAVTLYGGTVDDVYCYFRDSIAGPMKACPVTVKSDIFTTITGNLDKADLGLGPGHTVQQIIF